jgi:hypothetical protein
VFRTLQETDLYDDVVEAAGLADRAKALVQERLEPVRQSLEESEANQQVAALQKKIESVRETERKARGRIIESIEAYEAGKAAGDLDRMRKAGARRRAVGQQEALVTPGQPLGKRRVLHA